MGHSSINGVDLLDTHLQRNESGQTLQALYKINSNCLIGLNVKCKIIRLPEDSIVENLGDLGFGEGFFILFFN